MVKIMCDNCGKIHQRKPTEIKSSSHHFCSYDCRWMFIRKKKRYVQPLDKSIKYIPLTKGLVAIVDAKDYEKLFHFNWYAHKGKRETWYAVRDIWHSKEKRKEHMEMHRQLLLNSLIKGKTFVDHINHNGLDNRRCNIRTCTNSQNMANCRQHRDSSSPKGTYWDKQKKKWGAQICCNYKKYFLGFYDTVEEAVLAYNKKAKELFGNFTTPITSQEVVRP